ncbi:MAG: hypothetical protein LBK13_09715 [Spirochaetales bacterium]|jgi:hypothetical protein|nr:hypothetical protein [Spirochaetales bacterium]
MAKLVTKYTEEYICKKFLDNANIYMDFNPHNNYADIDLLVYGKVNGKNWKIIIYCDGIYQFNIMDHGVEDKKDIERCQYKPYIILEVNINKNKISKTPVGEYFNIKLNDFDIFSIEMIGVEKIINIICKFYKIETYEITEKEYIRLVR